MGITVNPFTGLLDLTGNGGAAPGTKENVYEVTLVTSDITNKYITLPTAPFIPDKTLLTIIGGPMQEYGVDFTISGAVLSWNGLALDGVLVAGDILIIQFLT